MLSCAAVQVDYNKPSGFDRARNREVGKKDITLETMEEAFTSEHWIVRIFKVSALCIVVFHSIATEIIDSYSNSRSFHGSARLSRVGSGQSDSNRPVSFETS